MDAFSQIVHDIHFSRAEYIYFMTRDHWHVNVDTRGTTIFHMVMHGDVTLRMYNGVEEQLQKGDMAIIPAGQQHHLLDRSQSISLPPTELYPEFRGHRNKPLMLAPPPSSTLVLTVRCVLDADMARPLLSALPEMMIIRGVTTPNAAGTPEWVNLGLQFLALEAERNRPGREALINRLVEMLFIECIRDHLEQLSEDSSSWLLALKDAQLAPVLSAIHSRPHESWTVASLASLACMSRSSFAERFNQVIGQPPLSYLAAHRLRLAAWNLRYNQQSIARISDMVGYGSETAFSQAFKRQYGVSPSQFRKLQQSIPEKN